MIGGNGLVENPTGAGRSAQIPSGTSHCVQLIYSLTSFLSLHVTLWGLQSLFQPKRLAEVKSDSSLKTQMKPL